MASRGPFMATTLPIALAMVAVTLGVAASGLCPARCRCNDENLRASCAQADLDVVPIQLNPEIHHLDLSNNRIDNLHRAFAFYVDLETLDLSSNLIHTLGANNFEMLENLIALNASNNQIRTISKSALYGLKRLGELNLSNNNITDIEEQAFRFTSELELLNLSGNSLTSLPDSLLKSLPRIRILLLNNNFLLEIPRTNLALAPSLEHINLADNLIQELDKDSLPSLPSLMSLNLADNVIRYIADGAFDRLPGLLKLNLSGNNLTSVPTPALARLNVLSTLILSRNPLESLDSVAFRNLFELRNLELNDCKIAQVHARAFADNVNLERISMDGNQRLTELPSRVLYGSRYLEWVSLRHCNLASLQPTQFPVDHLSYLRVGGNPLICNCSVHWLWNVIRAEERRNETRLQLDTRDILCADEEFVNKPLIALPEGSLRCRLSPLYLMLSAAGCLAATAMILALIAHVTRAKRKKRLPYTGPPNRPEFLVYVGRPNGELDKHSESYSRRLLTRNEESLVPSYDSPQRVNSKGSPAPPPPAPPPLPPPPLPTVPQETNIYETPRYGRSQDFYGRHPPSDDSGVYAVADVTNFRHEDHPEVHSAYRMPTPSAPLQTRRRDYVYDYDYNYDHQLRHDREHEYEREPCPVPDKPHVVFV